jgi:hypothetical protein
MHTAKGSEAGIRLQHNETSLTLTIFKYLNKDGQY